MVNSDCLSCAYEHPYGSDAGKETQKSVVYAEMQMEQHP